MTKKYIVTGGGGFVGKAICLALRKEGHEVIAIARNSYPELESAGVGVIQADISIKREFYSYVFSGADGVFHVASKVDMWGRYEDFFRTNVLGTRNIIQACREQGVRKLVYTSTPSVVAGSSDLENIDESYPYPEEYKAFYPKTKSLAEKEVLAAGRSRDLFALSLRPHLIFGLGDRNFVPTILRRAKEGRLMQVGKGENLVDFTYIEDCVQAHLCAMQALDENPACRGKAYFISQGDKVGLWWWIGEVLKRNGLPPLKRRVPKGVAYSLAWLCELFTSILPYHPEPLLTRFLVSEMSTHHYFNIKAAKRDLRFNPSCTVKEALDGTFGQLKGT